MITAVLDTNVLAAGLTSSSGTLASLVDFWRGGKFRVVVSPEILTELDRVFDKPYFRKRISPDFRADLIAFLAQRAQLVRLTTTIAGVASHPEDDLVLATAVSGNAGYIVTGDRELLRIRSYEDVQIVTPSEFLELLGRS